MSTGLFTKLFYFVNLLEIRLYFFEFISRKYFLFFEQLERKRVVFALGIEDHLYILIFEIGMPEYSFKTHGVQPVFHDL